MIENLRKYPGVIIAALIAVFIGFLLMDTQNFFRSGSDRVITVDGVSYSDSEYRRLGERSMQLLPMVSQQSGYMAMFALMGDSSGMDDQDSAKNFFVHRILLRKAGQDLGLVPSAAEIEKFVREESGFAQPSPTELGKKNFNQEMYDQFIKTGLGRYSMGERDFLDLIKDLITYEKINELLGHSVAASPEATRMKLLADGQKIDLQFIEFKLPEFESKQNPTEEELKAFWELKKDAYKTDARRRFSYILLKPAYEAGAEKAPEPPKAEKPGDPVPEPSAADKEIIKKRKNAEIEIADRLDAFLEKLGERQDAEFETLLKEEGFGELTKTDFFNANSIPDEMLKIQFRAGEQKNMNQFLFGSKITSDPLSKILYITTLANEQLLVKIDAEEPVRVKTFEEAKVEAKVDLIKENAIKQMKETAESARKNLAEAMAAGKSFADAVKDAGLTATSVKALEQDASQPMQPHSTELFKAARLAKPATICETTTTSLDNQLVIYVEKREIVKDPQREEKIKTQVDSETTNLKYDLFSAWMKELRANVEVK